MVTRLSPPMEGEAGHVGCLHEAFTPGMMCRKVQRDCATSSTSVSV